MNAIIVRCRSDVSSLCTSRFKNEFFWVRDISCLTHLAEHCYQTPSASFPTRTSFQNTCRNLTAGSDHLKAYRWPVGEPSERKGEWFKTHLRSKKLNELSQRVEELRGRNGFNHFALKHTQSNADIYCTPPCAKRPDGVLEDKTAHTKKQSIWLWGVNKGGGLSERREWLTFKFLFFKVCVDGRAGFPLINNSFLIIALNRER